MWRPSDSCLEELGALEICWKLEVAEGLLSLEIF